MSYTARRLQRETGQGCGPVHGPGQSVGLCQLHQPSGNMFQRPQARKSSQLIMAYPCLLPSGWHLGPVEIFETMGCQHRSEWDERHAIGGQHCSHTKPDAFQPFPVHIHGCALSLRTSVGSLSHGAHQPATLCRRARLMRVSAEPMACVTAHRSLGKLCCP